MRMMRRAGAVLLLVVIGLSFGFVVAEAGLRVVGWRTPGYYVNGKGPVALMPPGAHGGVYPRNTRGRLMHYDYDVSWSVNEDGFRERARTVKQPGTWRVGYLGDSFTAGMGVELKQRFPNLWFAAQKPQRPTELWNLATPLCGTACEAAILDGVGRKYELDEVVVAFYSGNDLDDNELWYTNPQALSSSVDQHTMRDWLREHSRTATFLWVTTMRKRAHFPPPGVYRDSTLQRVWPYTQRGLDALLAAAHGRRLTMLYLPALPEWSNEAWATAQQQWQLPSEGRHIVRARLADWARQHGVTLIDVSPWLETCSPGRSCIFPVDGHWNALGHKAVARGLVQVFKEEQ